MQYTYHMASNFNSCSVKSKFFRYTYANFSNRIFSKMRGRNFFWLQIRIQRKFSRRPVCVIDSDMAICIYDKHRLYSIETQFLILNKAKVLIKVKKRHQKGLGDLRFTFHGCKNHSQQRTGRLHIDNDHPAKMVQNYFRTTMSCWPLFCITNVQSQGWIQYCRQYVLLHTVSLRFTFSGPTTNNHSTIPNNNRTMTIALTV